MNCYIGIEAVKRKLGITSTTLDADVLAAVKAGSRGIDAASGRDGIVEGFFTYSGARIFDVAESIRRGSIQRFPINECLSVSALEEDTGGDGTFATTWDAADYILGPANYFPKKHIEAPPYGDRRFTPGSRLVRITGVWGYGNGRSATPWTATGATGTVGTTTGTTLTLSAATGFEAGQTILIGTEQMFISAIDSLSATVERGVNGTTAAAQSAAAISRAQYPDDVAFAALWFAIDAWESMGRAGILNERIADYSYQVAGPEMNEGQKRRMLNRVMREGIVPRYE